MFKTIILIASSAISISVNAKLTAPTLSDEAKAKAAEATAKTAWSGKVDAYKLCKAQDAVAVHYVKTATAAGKAVKPATATPACADPGAFVYVPPAPAAPA